MTTKLIDRSDWVSEPLKSLIKEAFDLSVLRHPSSTNPPLDSKLWENAFAVKVLSSLPAESNVLGVGAGLEVTSFMLAKRDFNVFATDIYLAADQWDEPAYKAFVLNPELVFPNFSRHRIFPLHLDARLLPFPDNYFDGVYSSGSLEHFGSIEDISQSIREIIRVMKVGARASISTEFRISGPDSRVTWDPAVYLFTKEVLEKIFLQFPEVKVVGGLENIFPQKVLEKESPTSLQQFLNDEPAYFSGEKQIYPNLLMSHLGFKFCSIHLELEKIGNVNHPRESSYRKKVLSADTERYVNLNTVRTEETSFKADTILPEIRLRSRLKKDYYDLIAALNFYHLHSRSRLKRFIAAISSKSLVLLGGAITYILKRYV